MKIKENIILISVILELVAMNFKIWFCLAQMDGIMMLKDPGTGKDVQMRIGCHSGPVVAGIVGLKMPRYGWEHLLPGPQLGWGKRGSRPGRTFERGAKAGNEGKLFSLSF